MSTRAMRIVNFLLCKMAGLFVALGIVTLTCFAAWYVFELRGAAMFWSCMAAQIPAILVYIAADQTANEYMRGL